MGNACSCQKIESEEEILSRIISSMKLREIETKCVYFQFLNCIYGDDFKINYFLFSEFISQIIGSNTYYRTPQRNFFENLRKRTDHYLSNVKTIGIVLILLSYGNEKTKIDFIIDYYFEFYENLNEKKVKEFLSYIIDSQTDNCISSFREIYSYESIQAFKEIYSKNRRKLLVNFIYRNLISVYDKYIKKNNDLLLMKENKYNLQLVKFEDFDNSCNIILNKPRYIKNKKRKSESLLSKRTLEKNEIFKKHIKNYSLIDDENRCNLKFNAFFCKDQEKFLFYPNKPKDEKYNYFEDFTEQKSHFLKNKILNGKNLKNDPQTNKVKFSENSPKFSFRGTENNSIYTIKNFSSSKGKKKFDDISNSIENQNAFSFYREKAINSENESAKFAFDSAPNADSIQNTPPSFNIKLNENEDFNCNLKSDKLLNTDINDLSFRKKESSKINLLDNSVEKDNTRYINNPKTNKPFSEINTDSKCNNYQLNISNNLMGDERDSLFNNKIKIVEYEKSNKGVCDKTLKKNSSVELYQKNHILPKEVIKDKNKFVYNTNNNIIYNNCKIDNKNNENKKDKNLNYLIFREFLELSFQYFNGDVIRNWLYDNFLREKQNE